MIKIKSACFLSSWELINNKIFGGTVKFHASMNAGETDQCKLCKNNKHLVCGNPEGDEGYNLEAFIIHLQMFFKIGVFKNFTNFTGNLLCWSLFLIKLQAWRPEGLQAFRPATLLKRNSNAVVLFLIIFYFLFH